MLVLLEKKVGKTSIRGTKDCSIYNYDVNGQRFRNCHDLRRFYILYGLGRKLAKSGLENTALMMILSNVKLIQEILYLMQLTNPPENNSHIIQCHQ